MHGSALHTLKLIGCEYALGARGGVHIAKPSVHSPRDERLLLQSAGVAVDLLNDRFPEFRRIKRAPETAPRPWTPLTRQEAHGPRFPSMKTDSALKQTEDSPAPRGARCFPNAQFRLPDDRRRDGLSMALQRARNQMTPWTTILWRSAAEKASGLSRTA
jgi:hypothetical protein